MKRTLILAAVAVSVSTASAFAATVTVNAFAPTNGTAGVWGVSDNESGGTDSVVNLTGAGGNLENNQPLPTGAAQLTTTSADASKAEVGISNNYGTAGAIINSNLNLAYSYYKANSGAVDPAAAPSMKLTFYNPNFVGDGYVTLVYEPYWQPGAGGTTTPDVWSTATINATQGLFWENGGFGVASGAGGPPLDTLSGWLSTFNANSSGAFSDATLVGIQMGMGTYNPSQVGYFDDVVINGTAVADTTYDFEPLANGGSATPLPSAANMGLGMLGLIGAAGLLRKKLRAA